MLVACEALDAKPGGRRVVAPGRWVGLGSRGPCANQSRVGEVSLLPGSG